MGKPLFYEIVEKPATSCIIGICSAVWFYIQKKNIGYSHVGLCYETSTEGHYWRIITSAFSHISVLHLVFNECTLEPRSCRAIRADGTRGGVLSSLLTGTGSVIRVASLGGLPCFDSKIQDRVLPESNSCWVFVCSFWLDDDTFGEATIIQAKPFWASFSANQFCTV